MVECTFASGDLGAGRRSFDGMASTKLWECGEIGPELGVVAMEEWKDSEASGLG